MVFKAHYRLIQVKSIEGEHSVILSTFIKLPFVIKTFVLSIFEWPFYTGFTVVTFEIYTFVQPSNPVFTVTFRDSTTASRSTLLTAMHISNLLPHRARLD